MACAFCMKVAVEKQTAPKLEPFRYQELVTATGGFSDEQLVGKGSHGSVYKAILKDGTKRVVAVKRANGVSRAGLEKELEILSKVRHERIVNLVGSTDPAAPEKLLVVELAPNGTLHDALHPPLPQDGEGESVTLPDWPLRARLAMQIAQGLLALHSAQPPIVHRDIKSANVLLDRRWHAKIADFGLAVRGRMEDVGRLRTPPAGTLGYLDPDYESPSRICPGIDVFSFGVLLLEMVSGRQAIDVSRQPAGLVDWALPKIKKGDVAGVLDPRLPALRNDLAAQLALLAARCVRRSSDRRPGMGAVVETLLAVSLKLPVPKAQSRMFIAPRPQLRRPPSFQRVQLLVVNNSHLRAEQEDAQLEVSLYATDQGTAQWRHQGPNMLKVRSVHQTGFDAPGLQQQAVAA